MPAFRIISMVCVLLLPVSQSPSETLHNLGTRVIVTGTNQFTNPSGVTNPSWQCIVDGVPVPSTTSTTPENRLLFCEVVGLIDEPHLITVNVTVSNQQTFWFDYIQYLPSASVPLGSAALSIDTSDPQFQYGTG